MLTKINGKGTKQDVSNNSVVYNAYSIQGANGSDNANAYALNVTSSDNASQFIGTGEEVHRNSTNYGYKVYDTVDSSLSNSNS